MSRAMEKEREGSARLIPIIVRPVDWHTSELSDFQALPKDALAITSWNNADEAWVDVAQQLRRILTEFVPTAVPVQSQLEFSDEINVSKETLEWLHSTEISFSHRNVDSVKLDDILFGLIYWLIKISKI